MEKLRSFVEQHDKNTPPDIHPADNWYWTMEQVKEQCKYQRNTKSAAGPDDFPPAIMPYLSDRIYDIIAKIYSFSWKHSVLPTEWVSGNVFALLKDPSKPINDPSNYRPITVTSIFIRTFEHLIHHQMVPLIKALVPPHSPLHKHQFGFREERSCTNAIHLLVSTVLNDQRVKPSSPVPVVFIDFAKAFDRVSHLHLMHLLYTKYGIRGRMYQWIYRWLQKNRRIRCVASSVASSWQSTIEWGVPQGAVLSPVLFLLFINEIAAIISNLCPLIDLSLYADDIAVFPKSKDCFELLWRDERMKEDRQIVERKYAMILRTRARQSLKKKLSQTQAAAEKLRTCRELAVAFQLQRALSFFTRWLAHVGMSANSSKSKVVVFSSQPISQHHWLNPTTSFNYWYSQLRLDGFTLSITDRYTYLGLVLDCQLNWKHHVQKVTTKVSSVSALLCKLYTSRNHSPHPLAVIKLIKSLLLPHIEYGIAFWCQLKPTHAKAANELDKLHTLILNPIRRAFNLPLSPHRLGLLVDCGLSSVYDIANKYVYKYYQRYASPKLHSDNQIRPLLQTTSALHNSPSSSPTHPTIVQLIKDAFYSYHIQPNTILQQKRLLNVGLKARFITEPELNKTLLRAQTNPNLRELPYVDKHVAHSPISNPAPRRNDVTPIEINDIKLITQLATFHQWQDQHASSHPNHARKTTAPLTTIKITPGIAPFLYYITNKHVITILFRLRHGRAYTHDTRARFANTHQPTPSTYCQQPACLTNQMRDSIVHLLIDCPSQTQLKTQLLHQWQQLNLIQNLANISDLTLSLLLGELPNKYNIKLRLQYTKWYHHLSSFILALYHNLPTSDQNPIPL